MLHLKIISLQKEPNDNLQIELGAVDNETLPTFISGQFITLVFHIQGKEVRRSYSLMTSPFENKATWTIGVKWIENGEISNILHYKLKVGDIVDVNEPQGQCTFVPNKSLERTIFLFAAGIGITPLLSIMKTVLLQEPLSKVVLIYSNKSEKLTPFRLVLSDLEKLFERRLNIVWIYSNDKKLHLARLNRDYIHSILEMHAVKEKSRNLFYTCGPIIYMDLCRFTLLGAGYEVDQIKKETFLPPENEMDEDDASEKVIDKNTYKITLLFRGKSYALEVPYYETILTAGLKQGIKLPYSCQSGMCSTCVSKCLQGKITMDYNEVLTDTEVENGRILLCTGHPTSNETVIEV